ncbi:hypothetical protein CIL05_06985 [Virgibacillus profundi]|uniref:Uncharacterized protein n=1 Tax=Virgibacillus profundi TaxID=2024555 RepID=A0A2A2IG34_9BACI|nr:hypothetical protein CIL05_06985 [Virgibacillus profundi]PXY54376.1 hypothetical protein CIT14_07070 [Virgibacillus profundi]
MNPISLLKTIETMSHEEVFNYAFYHLNGTQIRNIINYYDNEFSTFLQYDENLQSLNDNIKDKMQIFRDRLY